MKLNKETIIPVGEETRIVLDSCSWAVEIVVMAKGEPRWRAISWHLTLEQAAQACIERGLREHEKADLVTIVNTWDYFLFKLADIVGSGKYHSQALAEHGKHS
jgi:hypothetical protein